MKDIINSFKAHLYERTSSPLLGAFIFYWFIFNYKIVLILIDGKLSSNEKFIEIDRINKYDFYSVGIIEIPYFCSLFLPVFTTLIYIIVFPFISNFIHQIWVWHQNNLKKISNEQVLTKKEFGELRENFIELELSFDEKFKKKDDEILKLKSLIDKKDTQISNYQSKIEKAEDEIFTKNKEIQNIRNDLSNYQIEITKKNSDISNLNYEIKQLKPNLDGVEEKIIRFFADNYKKSFTKVQIEEETEIDELKTDYCLNKLKEKGLIQDFKVKLENPFEMTTEYRLSKEGKKYIVEKNFA